jgi:aminoglycoside 3-N-acetyltransferase I
LTSDDVTLLKELLHVFGHAFNDSETYLHAVPSDEYLTNLLGKEHFIVVVAMMGKAVVGGLTAYVLEKFEQQRREIYIYDLAVSDAHRRKGVATGTINALRKIAASQGAYMIFVQADLEDGPAIALYRSLGTMKLTSARQAIEYQRVFGRPFISAISGGEAIYKRGPWEICRGS